MRKISGDPKERERLRHVWRHMVDRCHLESDCRFKWYGARGIKVCDRWRASFNDFLADMGPRPPKTELDRVDNGGNYEPGNVRWATKIENARNKRNTRFLTISGVTRPIREWQEITGIDRRLLMKRFLLGWRDDKLLLKIKDGKTAWANGYEKKKSDNRKGLTSERRSQIVSAHYARMRAAKAATT